MKKIFTITAYWCCFNAILYAQPGAFDTSFANKGRFIAPNEFPVYIGPINAVAVADNGKIIMLGHGVNYSDSNGTENFAVIRLKPNGTMDSSFGDNGKVLIDFSTSDFYSGDYGYALALQPDGKIVVVGYANDEHYDSATNTYNYYDIAVARLNNDGSLDKSFDGDGKKLIDLSALTGGNPFGNSSYDYGYGVVINADNKICIMGDTYVADGINTSNYDAFILQLNSDGSFNNSFDNDGIKIINQPESDEYVYGFGMQSDNKFVLGGITGGAFSNYQPDILAIRLNKDGTLDNSFDGDGRVEIDIPDTYDFGSKIVLQNDGKILINGGQTDAFNSFFNFVVVRLNTDGSPDNSFNGDGIVTYGQPNEYNTPDLGLAVQPDGKIIQAGGVNTSEYTSSRNFIVIRYNIDGSVDNGFGSHGRSVIDFGNWIDGSFDQGTTCAIQSNGKIIAAGGSNGIAAATRLLVKGKLVTLDAPGDQTVEIPQGECTATVNNIDPILDPPDSHEIVNYTLYGATKDSGVGSLSGKQFNIGLTTAVYSLASNPLQRVQFYINTSGGTPAGALDFDGKNDYVDLGGMSPIVSGIYGEYSFEAWIKVRAYTNDDGLGSWIFGDERNLNGGIQVQLDTAGYITTFHPNVGFVKSSYKVPLKVWTHIAFVQSSTQLDLYVNGNFVQTLLTSPNLHYYDFDDFTLGAFTSDFINYTRHFNGQMDEVRVWERAICPAQIKNNMLCELAYEARAGLMSYYQFNQGIASCNNSADSILFNTGTYGYAQGMLKNFALTGSKSNWVKGHITGSCIPFIPLSLTCPDPITVNLDSGQCSAIVNFKATAVSGCDPNANINITYSQEPGTYFYPGTTYVYVNATDDLGNQQYCSFPVTVTESEPPVLITKDTTIALGPYGTIYVDPYILIQSVSDNCGLAYVNADAVYFDCNSIGNHLVTIYATDNSGNTTVGTATLTITPFATTSFVTVTPAPVQYSDRATFTTGIIGAANFFYGGCGIPATDVTFKLGQIALGTVSLESDFYGNLIATLDKQMTKGFLDSISSDNNTALNAADKQVTAIFNGNTTDAIQFKKKAITQLALAKEDAQLEYVGAQVINTKNTELAIPVSVRLTDIDDGYRGDITNASVTFTIEPITSGASILSADSKTTSDISFLNKDHTSGIAQEKFKVALGGNQVAKFRVTSQVGNLYKNKISVTVNVSTSANGAIASTGIASSDLKLTGAFDVTAMPNPSNSYFNLSVKSPEKIEKLSIKVMDIAGRVIESKKDINAGESIQLGKQYQAGTYLVEIRQGQKIKVLKLVKL